MAIADTGKAEAQPLSPEVWEVQQTELERLARRVAELEGNERRTLEMLKDGHSAHILTLRGDIAVSRRQLAHLLGDAYQELFAKLECGADAPETPQKPPICLQEPPVVVSGGDSASGRYIAPRLLIAWHFKNAPAARRRELHIGTPYEELKQYAEDLNRKNPHLTHWVEFEGEPV